MERKLITFDWAIKHLLRNKENFDILEGFLSELLYTDIQIIELLESESNQEDEKDKFNRVDVLAKDSNNALILIEVQYDRELDYFHRILYGSSKLITEYFEKSEKYSQLKKVITVHLIYFDLGSGADYLYKGTTQFIGINVKDILNLNETQKELFNTENVSDIFPQNYLIRIGSFHDEIKNTLDEWIYFFKNGIIKENFKAKNIDKAKQKLDVLKMNEKERVEYENYLENLSYQKSVFETARFEGRLEGKIEGIQEGEIKKSQQTLIKLLSKKFGLTDDEIALIKKCNIIEKLDFAIDDFVFAENKSDVLVKLKP